MSHLILQFTEIKKYKLRDNIQGEKPIFYIVENSENIFIFNRITYSCR